MTEPDPDDTTSKLTRVNCPVCGRSTRPHPAGVVRLHDDPDRPGQRCPGGGQPRSEVADA